ncbi:MAG: polysulfide reductase NrfD [Deltaproteobacteria bacterium]|nr:polysulfide reductase NrfD [Deltaproteobacteria bacterium]
MATTLFEFFRACTIQAFKGDRRYYGWMSGWTLLVVLGAIAYSRQLDQGLIVTGMSDQVSWGFYISNFTYLVGVAAAAVMLVLPAYIFHRDDFKAALIVGKSMAVAAVVMCISFVTVDLGRPDLVWHMLPWLGELNFPHSMLAWDVVVLSGYMVLNLLLIFYILFIKFQGREPEVRKYFWAVLLSIIWAISIHTVTAFLFSVNVSRPFWNTAVLAPRFLASAFASGPAFIILVLQAINSLTPLKVGEQVVRLLGMVVTVALQIHLFLIFVELTTDFYFETEHAASIRYLFMGLRGVGNLMIWTWASMLMLLIAVVVLSVHKLREDRFFMNMALVLVMVGIWIEKGMGMVVPGFIPTPAGEIMEYSPSFTELMVTLGIWSLGVLVFTVLIKISIPIWLHHLEMKALMEKSISKGRKKS